MQLTDRTPVAKVPLTGLSSDTDLDGQVNVFDLVGMMGGGRYGTGGSAVWAQGDFNYDGLTDVFDLVGIGGAGAYGAGSYLPSPAVGVGGVAAVPEPSGWPALTAALGIGWGGRCRWLRRQASRRPVRRGNC